MAPSSASSALSPAELSYLHTSLSLSPPIRPDCRTPTQFRPLYAETSILPGCNGSARIGFADGTEAVVGIKAEVERSKAVSYHRGEGEEGLGTGSVGVQDRDEDEENEGVRKAPSGQTGWVEMSIEIPGFRDDDALAVFLSQMLTEALLARGKSEGSLEERLVINGGWHWRIYIDVRISGYCLTFCKGRIMADIVIKSLDPAPITAPLIPSTSPVPNDTPRTSVDALTKAQERR